MIVVLALLAGLVQAEAEKVPEPAFLLSGHYAERTGEGGSACGAAGQVRTLDIYLLARPPHYRSANTGLIEGDLSSDGFAFTLTGADMEPMAEGSQSVSLRGGRIHTVGIYESGISSGMLTGQFTAQLVRLDSGDLMLESAGFEPRGVGRAETYVRDGRLPDGTRLRRFERCSTDPQIGR